MPSGSKTFLIERISSSAAGSAISRKYGTFSVPRPCSPEMAPPASTATRKISRVSALRFSASGWKTREVDVAVAHVAAPADERLVRGRQLGHLGQVVGDGRAGDDRVDDVVGARRLGHEEQPLPRRR